MPTTVLGDEDIELIQQTLPSRNLYSNWEGRRNKLINMDKSGVRKCGEEKGSSRTGALEDRRAVVAILI